MCPKIQIILLINFVKNDKINEKYLKYSSFMKKYLYFANIEKNVSVNLDWKQWFFQVLLVLVEKNDIYHGKT